MRSLLFYRPSRTYPTRLPQGEVVIVAPPMSPAAQRGFASWAQYLLPLVGSLGSVMFLFAYPQRSPFIVLATGSMVVVSVGGGVLTGWLQRRTTRKQQQMTSEKYGRYIEQQRGRLEAIAQLQRQVGKRLYPPVSALSAYVNRREYLWERRPRDEDFLHVRVGTGVVPLCCPVRLDVGGNPLADHNPALLALAHGAVATYAQIDDEPIAIPVRDVGSLALCGEPSVTHGLARALLCQVATFHAPDDVRILTYFPQGMSHEWEWLKWLPHTRRLRQVKAETTAQGEQLCLLADTPKQFAELLASQVMPEIRRRQALLADTGRAGKQIIKPHFIIVVDGFSPGGALAHMAALEELLNAGASLGVTLVTLVADRASEPAVLHARLDIASAGWMTYEETALGGRRIEGITADVEGVARCDEIARALAPLRLTEQGAQSDLTQDVHLLDLTAIASADEVDPATLWRERARDQFLQAPIGITSDGEPLILDIKESAEGGVGPHGLLIGATGSGKSELLRTIVTSMALFHDPEQVNFVLADFKGGASFADLARLPHVAGMITNLQSDLSLVDRMRAALFGEQERRQQLLREAGNLDNIQQYQVKRRTQPGLEPMPHLLIIVDEFAELLASRPDFLELFVAIGRVGRSLGMHLLLATQRLGEGRIQGLEGHLRYRICLRTFSAAESNAVIGSPDAFYLPSFPGIGYFKVDTTIYKQFKTALISTPYAPPAAQVSGVGMLREFTRTGMLRAAQAPVRAGAAAGAVGGAQGGDAGDAQPPGDGLQTDMDVVIERLMAGGARANPATPANSGANAVHQVWLPPLSERVRLGELFAQDGAASISDDLWPATPAFGPLRVPIGLLDRPLQQTQEPLYLDFSGAGGHVVIVGAPQSGKSTLLQTIVTALALTHTPHDVQIYCLDFGGGLLRSVEGLPHVGAVCDKTERERVQRLVHQAHAIMAEREYFFREHRIEGMAAYRQARAAGEFAEFPFGDVFLIVDDLAHVHSDFEQLEAELADIAAAGLTYGLHLALTSRRWAEVRPKLRDNIGTRLELRLNDPMESEFGKAAALALPTNTPGRGIIKGGLQFQVAQALGGGAGWPEERSVRQSLDALATRMVAASHGRHAPPLRILPTRLTPEDIAARWAERGGVEPAGIALGLEEFQLDPVYLDLVTSGPHFLVLGDAESGKTTILRRWIQELERRYSADQAQFALVDWRRGMLDFLEDPQLFAYACTMPMLKEMVERLKGVLDARLANGALTLEELRHPKRWSGPQYFLFVDDYESIPTTPSNLLAPLLDLIQQGRDVGFHVVLARRVTGTSRTAFEAVYQRLKETGSPGLILSGDSQEGALLGTQRASLQPPGRGYLVRRNQRTLLVQTVFAPPAAPEPDDER